MSVAQLVAVAAVVALAATVQLTAGFGFGLAAVPGLAVIVGAHDAVVVALALATITNAYQAWTGRTSTVRPIGTRMLVGAAAGLPVGLAVFVAVDERWLKAVIGVAVLAAVAIIARGIDLRAAGPSLDIGSGVLAGAMTTSTGINGPPLVFVLQARHLSPEQFRSTITTVFFTLDIASVVLFAVNGDITRSVLVAILVALPGQLAGATLGNRLRRHVDARRFRLLVLTLLSAAGTIALVSAAAG